MTRGYRVAGSGFGIVVFLVLGTWAFGASASETALRELDQEWLDAYSTRLTGNPSAEWRVERYEVDRRIALPVFSYYRGQSIVASGPISCADRRSVVAWYGAGALVVWQEGEWLPSRESVVHRRASGY